MCYAFRLTFLAWPFAGEFRREQASRTSAAPAIAFTALLLKSEITQRAGFRGHRLLRIMMRVLVGAVLLEMFLGFLTGAAHCVPEAL